MQPVMNKALASFDAEFETFCHDFFRPSIPAEWLIQPDQDPVLGLERQVIEQRPCHLYCSFEGLAVDNSVYVPKVTSMNRD